MQKYFEKIIEWLEKSKKFSCSPQFNKGIDYSIKIVNQVAEEYGDGWIPCEIRTPLFEIYEVGRLWVTMHRKGVNFYFSRQLKWNGYEGRWEWDNGKTLSDDWEVVAWRTVDIPAPYQPKGE